MTHSQDDNPIDRAEWFVWNSGRLLERLRFAFLFRGGEAERVERALLAYQNDDGGFGQALEPDYRGPSSQPLMAELALRILDELGALPGSRLLAPALAYLERVRASDGGLPMVVATGQRVPHAPWWHADPAQPGCLLPTAPVVALLLKHRVKSDFVARATEFCFAALAALPARIERANERIERLQIAYEVRAALRFLRYAPERERASQIAAQLGALLQARGLVEVADTKRSEAMGPLDYAPEPESMARGWFDDDLIARHLDALERDQQPDGGFTIGWQAWTPAAHLEWRAIQTVERLLTLRAYGRLG